MPELIRHANTLLNRKMLFGSDFPLIQPDRWLEDFRQVGFGEEMRPLILKQNALGLPGLGTNT